MVLAVCGGSPGDRDELDPGNGAIGDRRKSSSRTDAVADQSTAAATAGINGSRGGAGSRTADFTKGRSAEENTSAAAEAALQVNWWMFVTESRWSN